MEDDKPNPFAVAAGKIDLDAHELERVEREIKEALKVYEDAMKEEQRIFKTVDKLALRGHTHNQRYTDIKQDWDAAWRKVDRAYGAMQTLSARKHQIRHRGQHANGRRTARAR
jgi:hypothetical protein